VGRDGREMTWGSRQAKQSDGAPERSRVRWRREARRDSEEWHGWGRAREQDEGWD
jgi:hypothetical protein